MQSTFALAGIDSHIHVSAINQDGPRVLERG
jgi:hypothetical protein